MSKIHDEAVTIDFLKYHLEILERAMHSELDMVLKYGLGNRLENIKEIDEHYRAIKKTLEYFTPAY
jgi:hypothetical protein